MAEPQQKRMTADEFLIWHQSQEDKFELVDGLPVLKIAKSNATRARLATGARAMAGGTLTHSSIAANLQGHVFAKLRGSGCRPHRSDLGVRTSIDKVRYPELTVDCGPVQGKSVEATKPIAVLEVLSPSTRGIDLTNKLPEYMRHPALRTIVIVDTIAMDVSAHSRDSSGQWVAKRLTQPADEFAIQATPARLSLAEIYEGVTFDADGDTVAATS